MNWPVILAIGLLAAVALTFAAVYVSIRGDDPVLLERYEPPDHPPLIRIFGTAFWALLPAISYLAGGTRAGLIVAGFVTGTLVMAGLAVTFAQALGFHMVDRKRQAIGMPRLPGVPSLPRRFGDNVLRVMWAAPFYLL